VRLAYVIGKRSDDSVHRRGNRNETGSEEGKDLISSLLVSIYRRCRRAIITRVIAPIVGKNRSLPPCWISPCRCIFTAFLPDFHRRATGLVLRASFACRKPDEKKKRNVRRSGKEISLASDNEREREVKTRRPCRRGRAGDAASHRRRPGCRTGRRNSTGTNDAMTPPLRSAGSPARRRR